MIETASPMPRMTYEGANKRERPVVRFVSSALLFCLLIVWNRVRSPLWPLIHEIPARGTLASRTRAIATALTLVIAACTAPQYDLQTDKLISQLQNDVDTKITTLITLDHKIERFSQQTGPAARKALASAKTDAGYEANTDFYDKVDVDLTALQTRIDAEPSTATPFLDNAIKDLRANLLTGNGSMEATHQKVDVLSEPYLQTTRDIIDAQIGALLTRELGLKHGASTSSPNVPSASNQTGATARPVARK